MSAFLDAAADYVSLGWMVFPLAKGRKLPAISKKQGGMGFGDATDDHDKLLAYDRRFPGCNIGIATGQMSGITVIDVDPRNGGFATISALASQGFLFSKNTPEARTGNGGRHLIFEYHHLVRASKNRLGPGIDVKTDGGYIVGAPSIIDPSDAGPGGKYRWVVNPCDVPLPRAPMWLVDKLKPPPEEVHIFNPQQSTQSAERALEAMAFKLAREYKGNRNDLLNWCAFRAGIAVAQGKLGRDSVTARLTQAALAAGLKLPETRATIASGLRAAATKGR